MTCKFAHAKVIGCSDLDGGMQMISATHALGGEGKTVSIKCGTCSVLPLVAGDPTMERMAQLLPVITIREVVKVAAGKGGVGGEEEAGVAQGAAAGGNTMTVEGNCFVQSEDDEGGVKGKEGWKLSSCAAAQNFESLPGVAMRRMCACSAGSAAGSGAIPGAAGQAEGAAGPDEMTTVKAMTGQSCSQACEANGRTCTSRGFAKANTCEVMKARFSCTTCTESEGPDQPCFVDSKAPKAMQPGTCLVKTDSSVFDCAGKHPKTSRLCVCC
jgi:hypothetical protein